MNVKSKKQRDTNMEMVRIIAMTMILTLHCITHTSKVMSAQPWWPYLPVIVGGVDLFMLVSGYFGIRLRWQSVLSLAGTVVGFVAINLGLTAIFNGDVQHALDMLYQTLMDPFSGHYWFISVFFALMLFSPLINRATDAMSLRDLRLMIVILAVFEGYFCFIWGKGTSMDGQDIANFIYLYMLGRYIRREPWFDRLRAWHLWLALAVVIGLHVVMTVLLTHTAYTSRVVSHANPLLILKCICILLLCRKIRWQSRIVNAIATAAFGAYLLNDGAFGYGTIYPWLGGIYKAESAWVFASAVAGYVLGTWAASGLLSPIVKAIVTPVAAWISRILPLWTKFAADTR